MRKGLLSVLALLLMTGCAQNKYLQNRANDAADIFTITTGAGAGAKARVGPFHGGLFGNMDMAGLRGGTAASKISFDDPLGLECDVSFFAIDAFDGDARRGKDYSGFGGPVLTVPFDSIMSPTTHWSARHIPHIYKGQAYKIQICVVSF
ncbi:MAG: hypothetical protein M0T70_07315 [Geobacteraceae bacterium]|nr:hypothetical protein [Geobacteraceae bacterium]